MSTYVIGYCDSDWFPEFFTHTDNQELLDDYCDLQLSAPSEDAVHAYSLLTDEHQLQGLTFVPEELLQSFVHSLSDQYEYLAAGDYF